VDSSAETDVTEDTPLLLGDTGLTVVWLLETSTTNQDTANHMPSHHVTTTSMEPLPHAPTYHNILPQLVKDHVSLDTITLIPMISTSEKILIPSLELKKSSKKFSPMDQLKDLSPSMKISLPTSQEFINTLLELPSEDTLLRSLDGELKEVSPTGYVLTHGTTNGVITDSSRSSKETLESTTVWLLDSLKPIEFSLRFENIFSIFIPILSIISQLSL